MTGGFFDSVTEVINGGVAYADKKTQIMRYRSELSTLAKQKTQAFSDLGMAVLNHEAGNQQFVNVYADQVSVIRSLEQRENELKTQIDGLQRDMTSNAGGQSQGNEACPQCGAYCSGQAAFCANCGAHLAPSQQISQASIPEQCDGMMCRTCGVQYPADYVWCERCRSRLEPISGSNGVNAG